MGTSANAVHIDEDRVTQWVKECVRKLIDDPDRDWVSTSSGDTFVVAYWDDAMIEVVVAQGYWTGLVDPEDREAVQC